MRIDVTEDDIRQGRPRNEECCPAALALRRALRPGAKVRVGCTEITIDDAYFDLPKRVARFIRDFDSKPLNDVSKWSEPEPFSFELPIEVTT
jgi:hypothetical protein